MPIRAFIADDEILARQKLRVLLSSEKDIEIVGESGTAEETIDLVQVTSPDLLFLDIQMPDMDGFEIISAVASRADVRLPSIIFTTAYDRYALQAFEINAVDYVLKPFTQERLSQALRRARSSIAGSHSASVDRPVNESRFISRIVFKSKGRILFLPVSDIRWIGAEENYVRISTGRDSHLLRKTMAHLESRLDPESFIRVHRSTIVNLRYVKEIRKEGPEGESFVLMADGQHLPVSRGYRARITQMLSR